MSQVAPEIPGLRYLPNYLDPATHDELLRIVSALPWQIGGRRRFQSHGYAYDSVHKVLRRTGELPDWSLVLAERLHRDGLIPQIPDYLLTNAYEPGQGIFSHVDIDLLGDTVISVSLGSTAVMEFADTQSDARTELLLEPASALALSGDARSRWQHAIPPRTHDEWNGRTIERARRVSLTFRKVLTRATR